MKASISKEIEGSGENGTDESAIDSVNIKCKLQYRENLSFR